MAKRNFVGKRDKEKASSVDVIVYKFRGYPNTETEKQLWRNINGCRGFWNILVSDNSFMYKNMGFSVSSTPADYKDASGYEWLQDIDSLALANVQLNYQKAMSAFFSGEANYPKHKKKRRSRDTYTTNCSNQKHPNLFLDGSMLKLPKIKEPVCLNVHRKIKTGGVLKNCTVSHDVTGWYFSLSYEYPKVQAEHVSLCNEYEIQHIGLDMSLPHLYVDSNGDTPDFTKPYKKLEQKLVSEQKKLSRMERSNIDHYAVDMNGYIHPVYRRPLSECKNYQKQLKRVEFLHARIKHKRDDMLHKLSAKLTDQYDVISIEDINMAALKRSMKLGKSASDIGWGRFTEMLT